MDKHLLTPPAMIVILLAANKQSKDAFRCRISQPSPQLMTSIAAHVLFTRSRALDGDGV
jgi:hypothetical protein